MGRRRKNTASKQLDTSVDSTENGESPSSPVEDKASPSLQGLQGTTPINITNASQLCDFLRTTTSALPSEAECELLYNDLLTNTSFIELDGPGIPSFALALNKGVISGRVIPQVMYRARRVVGVAEVTIHQPQEGFHGNGRKLQRRYFMSNRTRNLSVRPAFTPIRITMPNKLAANKILPGVRRGLSIYMGTKIKSEATSNSGLSKLPSARHSNPGPIADLPLDLCMKEKECDVFPTIAREVAGLHPKYGLEQKYLVTPVHVTIHGLPNQPFQTKPPHLRMSMQPDEDTHHTSPSSAVADSIMWSWSDQMISSTSAEHFIMGHMDLKPFSEWRDKNGGIGVAASYALKSLSSTADSGSISIGLISSGQLSNGCDLFCLTLRDHDVDSKLCASMHHMSPGLLMMAGETWRVNRETKRLVSRVWLPQPKIVGLGQSEGKAAVIVSLWRSHLFATERITRTFTYANFSASFEQVFNLALKAETSALVQIEKKEVMVLPSRISRILFGSTMLDTAFKDCRMDGSLFGSLLSGLIDACAQISGWHEAKDLGNSGVESPALAPTPTTTAPFKLGPKGKKGPAIFKEVVSNLRKVQGLAAKHGDDYGEGLPVYRDMLDSVVAMTECLSANLMVLNRHSTAIVGQCHGAVQASTVIFDNIAGVILLDYAYVGNHHVLYDLISFEMDLLSRALSVGGLQDHFIEAVLGTLLLEPMHPRTNPKSDLSEGSKWHALLNQNQYALQLPRSLILVLEDIHSNIDIFLEECWRRFPSALRSLNSVDVDMTRRVLAIHACWRILSRQIARQTGGIDQRCVILSSIIRICSNSVSATIARSGKEGIKAVRFSVAEVTAVTDSNQSGGGNAQEPDYKNSLEETICAFGWRLSGDLMRADPPMTLSDMITSTGVIANAYLDRLLSKTLSMHEVNGLMHDVLGDTMFLPAKMMPPRLGESPELTPAPRPGSAVDVAAEIINIACRRSGLQSNHKDVRGYVVSGTAGSGKTTFLKQVVALLMSGHRTVEIENDLDSPPVNAGASSSSSSSSRPRNACKSALSVFPVYASLARLAVLVGNEWTNRSLLNNIPREQGWPDHFTALFRYHYFYGRVVFALDNFDELPPATQVEVIRVLNDMEMTTDHISVVSNRSPPEQDSSPASSPPVHAPPLRLPVRSSTPVNSQRSNTSERRSFDGDLNSSSHGASDDGRAHFGFDTGRAGVENTFEGNFWRLQYHLNHFSTISFKPLKDHALFEFALSRLRMNDDLAVMFMDLTGRRTDLRSLRMNPLMHSILASLFVFLHGQGREEELLRVDSSSTVLDSWTSMIACNQEWATSETLADVMLPSFHDFDKSIERDMKNRKFTATLRDARASASMTEKVAKGKMKKKDRNVQGKLRGLAMQSESILETASVGSYRSRNSSVRFTRNGGEGRSGRASRQSSRTGSSTGRTPRLLGASTAAMNDPLSVLAARKCCTYLLVLAHYMQFELRSTTIDLAGMMFVGQFVDGGSSDENHILWSGIRSSMIVNTIQRGCLPIFVAERQGQSFRFLHASIQEWLSSMCLVLRIESCVRVEKPVISIFGCACVSLLHSAPQVSLRLKKARWDSNENGLELDMFGVSRVRRSRMGDIQGAFMDDVAVPALKKETAESIILSALSGEGILEKASDPFFNKAITFVGELLSDNAFHLLLKDLLSKEYDEYRGNLVGMLIYGRFSEETLSAVRDAISERAFLGTPGPGESVVWTPRGSLLPDDLTGDFLPEIMFALALSNPFFSERERLLCMQETVVLSNELLGRAHVESVLFVAKMLLACGRLEEGLRWCERYVFGTAIGADVKVKRNSGTLSRERSDIIADDEAARLQKFGEDGQVVMPSRKFLGTSVPDRCVTSKLLLTYAQMLVDMGWYSVAHKVIMKADVAHVSAFSNQDLGYSRLLSLYAEILSHQKSKKFHEQSVQCYEDALVIMKEHQLEDTEDYAVLLERLAVAYSNQGDYKISTSLFRKSLLTLKKISGEQCTPYVGTMMNAATSFMERGDYDAALAHYFRAMDLCKEAHGAFSPMFAQIVNNIAMSYESKGEYEEAHKYYEGALRVWREVEGEEGHSYLITLANTGILHRREEKHLLSIKILENVLSKTKEVLGESDPLFSSSTSNLAMTYSAMGQHDMALFHFLKALEIAPSRNPDDPTCAEIQEGIADVYLEKGEHMRALDYYQKALTFRRRLENNGPDGAPTVSRKDILTFPELHIRYKIAMVHLHLKQQRRVVDLLNELLTECDRSLRRREIEGAKGAVLDIFDLQERIHDQKSALLSSRGSPNAGIAQMMVERKR